METEVGYADVNALGKTWKVHSVTKDGIFVSEKYYNPGEDAQPVFFIDNGLIEAEKEREGK